MEVLELDFRRRGGVCQNLQGEEAVGRVLEA